MIENMSAQISSAHAFGRLGWRPSLVGWRPLLLGGGAGLFSSSVLAPSSFLLLVVRHLLLVAMHLFLVASLLLVAMPFAPSSKARSPERSVHASPFGRLDSEYGPTRSSSFHGFFAHGALVI